jgi:hypothetical protein
MDGPLGAIDGLNGETSDCETEGRKVGPAVGHELGKIDGIDVGSPVTITVGALVNNELVEIDGTTDGRDDGPLDGTDKGVSVGSMLGVSLGFRLGKIDGSTDGTDDGRDDGPLVASDGLVEESLVDG